MLHWVISRDVDTAADSSPKEWCDMLEREAKAMHKANRSHFNFLKELCESALGQMGITIELELQDEDNEEEKKLNRAVKKA